MRTIEIVGPDPGWASEFRAIAAPLRAVLGDIALRIDHIGSTSVPGLPAKNVIDIQIAVTTLDADAILKLVAPLGYTLHPRIRGDHVPPGWEGATDDWDKLYLVAPDEQRPTHVHIRRMGALNQRYPILFRDYLRGHPEASEAYAQIKRALARLHPHDQDAYYDVKDPVCDLIAQAAEQWARHVGWTQDMSDA